MMAWVEKNVRSNLQQSSRGERGWLSHGLVVTLLISYSLDGGTLLGFSRDMRIADCTTTSFANFSF